MLPNVGAVPYGASVEQTAALLDVLPPAPGPGDAEPAEAGPAAAWPAGPALSPSRAADFMTCPLLYRFRVIDKLPEPPSEATARGTLVHAALERLFDLPAADRTPQAHGTAVPHRLNAQLVQLNEQAQQVGRVVVSRVRLG